jgi:hypothetical protein
MATTGFRQINSAEDLYLVIDSIERDAKHPWPSNACARIDGAEGMAHAAFDPVVRLAAIPEPPRAPPNGRKWVPFV